MIQIIEILLVVAANPIFHTQLFILISNKNMMENHLQVQIFRMQENPIVEDQKQYFFKIKNYYKKEEEENNRSD